MFTEIFPMITLNKSSKEPDHGKFLSVVSGNFCTEGVETDIDVFVATVYLVDVADHTGTLRGHCCNEKGDTCTDIRRCHLSGTELITVVMAHYHCPVRIAEDNLRTHVNELVNKEEAALEHLLVDEHATLALGSHHKNHTQKVR